MIIRFCRIMLSIGCLVGFSGGVNAQVSSFTSTTPQCLNQFSTLQNNSSGASSYLWDFCQDAFKNPSNATLMGTITSNVSEGLEVINDDGHWYGFMFSRNDGKLLRLDLGSSLGNTIISVTDLGNIGGLLNLPTRLKILKEGGSWYAFITNFGNSHLIRAKFGASLNALSTDITATDLGNYGGGNGPRGLDFISIGSDIIVSISYWSDDILTLVKFTNTVEDNPAVGTAYNITSVGTTFPGSNGPMGISLQYVNGSYYAIVAGNKSGKIFHLNFGSNLFSQPVVNLITSLSGPTDAILKKDGLNYYAFVEQNAALVKIDFGADLQYSAGIGITNLGSFSGLLNDAYGLLGLSIVREGANWRAFIMKQFQNQVVKIDFNDVCGSSSGVNFNTLSTQNPSQIFFNKAGTYMIELISYSASGNFDISNNIITVSNTPSPTIDFTVGNICVNNYSDFTISSSATLNQWSWNFGDGQTSVQASPSNLYAGVGSFDVSLDVTATNGCSNHITKTVAIYNPPTSAFTLPTNNPLCTNQQVTFTNTSTFDAGSSPSWEWFVNGTSVSMVKDLQQSFSTASPQTVKLKASIPGCFNESSQVVNSLLPGPQLGFTITGKCEDNDIAFINTTTDPVTGYSWDFGDTQTSTATDVLHTYSNPGSYTVSLQGSSANGCQNTVTKNLIIYTQPQPSFSLSLPPFSCSGSASQFTDLTPNPTDSNIASWAWNFDDAGSNQNSSSLKNPTHVYATASNYNVSLTATTNFGCSGTFQKQVTVSQSPTASFTNTPACKNVPVIFTDTSTGNITSWYWQMDNTFYFVAQPKPTHIFTAAKTYPVSLTVTASNSCVSVITKNLVIPATLVPDFNFQKNCTNQNTVFTDITNAPSDPVVTSSWDVTTLGSKTGSPAIYTFPATGTYNVTLSVTAQSGCVYSITNPVSIVESPVAGFTATPDAGVPPLTVQFTNSSVQAKYYNWAFNDGSDNSTSTDPSPSHIFQGYGEYAVDLTASNDLGCVSTLTQIIKAVLPIKDISLIGFNIIENPDGSLKIIASLKNNGNVVLSNLSLVADVSGLAAVRENIEGPIAPNTIVNHTLAYEILKKNNLNFLCGEIELDGDVHPDDNKICSSITGDFFLYAPYPNPSSGTLHVDWIASEGDALVAIVYDAMGKLILDSSFQSSAGLNSAILNLVGLDKGIYLVSIKSTGINKVYKIAIVH